jgi:membrane protein YdbS with pleckstrin-like domain
MGRLLRRVSEGDSMKKKTDPELLEHGRALYARRRWHDSAAVFSEVIANGRYASHGMYGIALIRLATGDVASARRLLLNSVRIQPKNANAHFYLGEIARTRGEQAVADARYRLALRANPAHRGARQRLSELSRNSKRASAPRAAPVKSAQRQPKSKQAAPVVYPPTPAELLLARIKALNFSGRQKLAPFAWTIGVRILAAFACAFFIVGNRMLKVSAGQHFKPDIFFVFLIFGAILLGLWWVKEKLKSRRFASIAATAAAAIVSLFMAGLMTGILTRGMRDIPQMVFLWLVTSAIWSLPLVAAIRGTVFSVHDGSVNLISGVFHRTSVSAPFYAIQAASADHSGLGRRFGEADIACRYGVNAGTVRTMTARGVGSEADLKALASNLASIAGDLRSGAWRSGTNYLWGPSAAAFVGAVAHSIGARTKHAVNPVGKRRGV